MIYICVCVCVYKNMRGPRDVSRDEQVLAPHELCKPVELEEGQRPCMLLVDVRLVDFPPGKSVVPGLGSGRHVDHTLIR